MKRLIAGLLISALIPMQVTACGIEAKLKRQYPKAKICTVMQINRNPNILLKRKNRYTLIEKIRGVVINKRKDGRITNTNDKRYNYISYRGVKGVRKGSRVTTYCVYDNTNGEDTIIRRIDIVTKRY